MQKIRKTNESIQRKLRYGRTNGRTDRAEFIGPFRLCRGSNKLQEHSLQIVYEDYTASFDSLWKKDKNKTIHQKNIEKLAIQMYKIKNNTAPKIVCDLFPVNNNCYSL